MLAAVALQSKDKQVTQAPADARGLAVTRELQDSLDYQASQGLEVLAQVVVPRVSQESVGQREKRVTQACQALALKDFPAHLASPAHLDLLDHRAHLALLKPAAPAFLDSLGCLEPEELQVQVVSKATEVTLVTAHAKEEAPQDWLVYPEPQETTASLATLDRKASKVMGAHQASLEDKAPMDVMVTGVSLAVKERKGYPTTLTWDWE